MRVVRLLLIDDEVRFVETLSKRLTARGFHVLGACSGSEGLDRLDREPVDVVLLDVRMPGMSGLEVLKVIRNRHPLVRVVLLSGDASIDAAVEGLKHGAVDYLLKPVEIDDVLARVEDAFERKRIEEAEAAEKRSR